MARLGTTRSSSTTSSRARTAKEAVRAGAVKHKHVPGVAHNVKDPVVKLLNMLGTMFNEPTYYNTASTYTGGKHSLVRTGKFSTSEKNDLGLTDNSAELIETMAAVAQQSPEDLLVIASWARDPVGGLRLRTTPQVMFAVAAAFPESTPYLVRYASKVMVRPDDCLQVFATFRHLFQQSGKNGRHVGSLPNQLKKALALRLHEFSHAAILKYDSNTSRPNFKDLLLMLRSAKLANFLSNTKAVPHNPSKITRALQRATGSKVVNKNRNVKQEDSTDNGWPVSQDLFEYLVNGKYLKNLSPTLRARKEFFELDRIGEVSSKELNILIETAGLTWENVLSKFGSSTKVWELMIPFMNEMALTRNLRNFEQANISEKSWDIVHKKLGDVENTVQLPFRFFTAAKETTTTNAHTVVSEQLDKAVKNLPDLEGVTFVLADNSGSAQSARISSHGKEGRKTSSDTSVADCGNMLEAVIAKRYGRKAIIGVFGDRYIEVPFKANDSTLSIKEKIDQVAKNGNTTDNRVLGIKQFMRTGSYGVGQSTETGLWSAIDDITQRKVHVDRIILLSDLCCYTQPGTNCGFRMADYFGTGASLQQMVDRYRSKVNKNVQVYSVNLAGYGQTQTVPGSKSHIMSGWSEKILSLIHDIENPEPANKNKKKGEESKDPATIQALRTKYMVQ